MSISDVAITAGVGTEVRAYKPGAGDYIQVIQEVRATAKSTSLTNIPWLVTSTGLANVIPADVTRVGLLIVSEASGILYIRLDSTIPTVPTSGLGAYDYYLNTGDRWEVPIQFAQLTQSWIGSVPGGYVYAVSGTCA
jgi:hypothetical protein